MSERSYLFEGTRILTLEQFQTEEKREGIQYLVSDAPGFGITNAQMRTAIENNGYNGYYKNGDVYFCLDAGEYAKDTIYKFVTDGITSRWEGQSNSSLSFSASIDSSNWIFDASTSLYRKIIPSINADLSNWGKGILLSAVVIDQSKDTATLAGLKDIGRIEDGGALVFSASKIPSEDITIEFSAVRVSNENSYFTIANIGNITEGVELDGFQIYPNQFVESPFGKYQYVSEVAINEISLGSDVYVTFDMEAAASGLFGLVEAADGYLRIFASERPDFIVKIEKVEIK